MRTSLAIIIFLAVCSPCLGDTEVIVIGQPTSAADYSDIVLWEDFTDNSPPYTITSSNCNTGTDTAWSLNSGAAINTDAALSGTYGVDSPTQADYAYLDIASGDYFNADKGAVVFMFQVTTWLANNSLLRFADSAGDDRIVIRMLAGAEVGSNWVVGGASEATCATTDADLATATPYYLVYIWDPAGSTKQEIHVYTAAGAEVGTGKTSATAITTLSDIETAGYVQAGEAIGGDTSDFFIDKVIVFDGSVTRTAAQYLEIAKDISSCPL